jgi:TrmH family RNA methyltransferase
MEHISSRQNSIVKQFRMLLDPPRHRGGASDADRLLLDGAHLLEEALDANLPIDVVAIRDDVGELPAGTLARRAAAAGARLISVTTSVLSAISPVRQPSGIVAIARQKVWSLEAVFAAAPPLILMLADVQDPGNVGAVVRAAEACGATGVVTSAGSADPFGWKALRGSMGSTFRMPVAAHQPLPAAVQAARERGIRVYAAVPRAGTPLPRCDMRPPSAVLLGGEGPGLEADLAALADEPLTIPMRGSVESLNVATAAALITYEALRQRESHAS